VPPDLSGDRAGENADAPSAPSFFYYFWTVQKTGLLVATLPVTTNRAVRRFARTNRCRENFEGHLKKWSDSQSSGDVSSPL
jgi:hypothetical protein